MKRTKLLFFMILLIMKAYSQDNHVVIIDSTHSTLPASSSIKLDSLLNSYFKGCNNKTDTALYKKLDSKKSLTDSLIAKHKPRLIDDLKGKIGIGYQFGLLTGYIDSSTSAPLHVLNSQGDLEVTTLGIPLNFSYNYSTFRNPLGVNNYFRASVNLEKYKQLKQGQRDELKANLGEKIQSNTKHKDLLKGKLGYSEILLQRLKSELDKRKKSLENQANNLDDFQENGKDRLGDSMQGNNGSVDSLRNDYETKKAELDKYMLLYDSVQRTYHKLLNTYQKLEGLIDQYSDKKQYIDNYDENGLKSLGGNWLKNVTKLDFGLTYPSTTGLTKNSIPIKGVDFETQNGNWYTAVSAGVTLNNLMVTNDVVQNKLFYSKNLFNQFDFQEIRTKRFIALTKTGYGTKDGSHFFIGVRYTNKAVMLGVLDSDTTSNLNPSMGVELDGRIKPKKLPGTILDLVYGKTSNTHLGNDSLVPNPFTSLFSNSRTHTALVKLTQPIQKLRSQLTTSVRWIDPKADMASLGVLQPNNMRYEITTRHALLKNLDVGLIYRFDKNNVDNAIDSTLKLRLIGGNFNGSLAGKLTYFGNMNFILQETSRLKQSNKTNENYMFSLGTAYKYKIVGYENAISIMFSEYRLTTVFNDGLYRNYGLQHLTRFDKGQNSFSVNIFETTQSDSVSNKSIIIGDEWSISRDRFQLTLGMKISYSKEFGDDLGGKVELKTLLTDQLQWTIKAEKFILGNFHNSFDPLRFERFPYAITTQLNYTLK